MIDAVKGYGGACLALDRMKLSAVCLKRSLSRLKSQTVANGVYPPSLGVHCAHRLLSGDDVVTILHEGLFS